MMKLIILFLLYSCTASISSLTPEELAVKYQETRYLDYENSYKLLWPNSVKKEDFMKFNVSFINFKKLKHKFKFKLINTEGSGDERVVTVNVTRPDIETISKNIFQQRIGKDKKTIENLLFIELNDPKSPTKTIPTKVYLKQGKDKVWYVLPKY